MVNVFRVESTGVRDALDILDAFTDDMPRASLDALGDMEKVVEDKIRENYIQAGGTNGDFIYDSIGRSVNGESDGSAVYGTVGIYSMTKVESAHGRTEKDIPAARLAYWMEYGTSTLNANAAAKYGRKAKFKKIDYPETELNFRAPRPFISAAFYSTIDKQTDVYLDTLLREVGIND